jgi:hypothetical protein
VAASAAVLARAVVVIPELAAVPVQAVVAFPASAVGSVRAWVSVGVPVLV